MNTPRAPDIDTAWAWLISFVPAQWQPSLGIAAAAAVFLWLLINGLKSVFELFNAIREFFRRGRERRAAAAEVKLPAPRVSIWNPDINSPPRPKPGGIPVITTANMKGGVGKTTFTANFAAYLDAKGKRVLLIDLDYQGSLSQTATAAAGSDKVASVVDDIITLGKSPTVILANAQSLGPVMPRSHILTCYYEFSDTEAHELVNWVVAKRTGQPTDDIRFRMTQFLSDDAVQRNYDVVLIDAPPRFSTGTINALCASTHLVIPTILDRMSVEAVIYFSRDIERMRAKLFPSLKLVGVVPTMVQYKTRLMPAEVSHAATLDRDLAQYWRTDRAVLRDAFVPDKSAFRAIAGSGIGYIDAGKRKYTLEVREIFDRVGKIIAERVRL
ncbi:MAG: ParA family protein [Hyphomonadaceae bacterium]|nr:ParA family protein [Hyphomonadaceae bacterium]